MLKQTRRTIHRTIRALGHSLVALALAASMTALPTSASAEELASASGANDGAIADAVAQWAAASESASQSNYSPYSYVSDDPTARTANNGIATLSDGEEDATSYPENYDLRSLGVVTPVKDQSPWGTCWGFAAIAASEVSILSEAETTYEETGLDLSERALAWLVFDPVPEAVGSQAGEGAHFTNSETSPNARLNYGGFAFYATTLFSAGTGLLPEELVPYKNEEGKIDCRVLMPDASNRIDMTLTADEISELEAAGATVTKYNYAATIIQVDTSTGKVLSEEPATWAVSDEYWGATSYELEESSILPEYRILDWEGECVGTSTEAINATKSELVAGRAVAVCFKADQSMPGYPSTEQYLDTTHWAHYTYETAAINHVVTVVGWDDSYSKENFGNGDASKQPPADGAWIAKNSWGASTEDFPNKYNWGVVDEDGQSTGYFYLSYYDKSIAQPESFNYDLNLYSDSEEYLLYQYDFLSSDYSPVTLQYDSSAPEANVFTAESNSIVRSFGCQTTRPNTQVTYEMYLLNEDASNPQDGKLVASTTATYDYGGYHRVTLDEADWVKVKEGQKFSVVVTQYCLDDGKYYQSATRGYASYTEEELEEYRHQQTEYYEKEAYSIKHDEALQGYLDQGLSQEEAEAKAVEDANAYVKLASTQEEIAQKVEADLAQATQVEYQAVVNEGESYTYTATAGASKGTWTDWSLIIASMEASSSYNVIYDNFPVKAYAEIDTAPQTVDKPNYTIAKDLVYNGGEQTGVDVAEAEGYSASGVSGTNAGSYTATIKLDDGYTWADGTTDDITLEWSIAKKAVSIKANDATMVAGATLPTFTGKVEGVCAGDDLKVGYIVEPGSDTSKPGTCRIVSVWDTENTNYEVSVLPGTLTVTAAPAPVPTKVEKPTMTAATDLVYNGVVQTGVTVAESDYYTVTGAKETNANTYVTKVSLNDKEKYQWTDGTTDDLTLEWAIAKKAVSIRANDATMVAGATLPTFTGEVEGVCAGDNLKVGYIVKPGSDTSQAGTYGIVPVWDEENTNYEVSAQPGTLTVTAAPEPAGTVVRISGDDRYSTMQQIVNDGFTAGSTKVAVLATGENFPDALVASTIAGAYDAPVLLTETGHLSEQAKAEIERLGIDTVYVLGGTASVSDEVLAEVAALGAEMDKAVNVVRVSGENRADTSLEAINVMKGSAKGNFDTVVVASGKSREGVFGDALSISPYAYAKNAPILLTDGEGMLTADELAAIKANTNVKNIIIVGGSASVADVEGQLGSSYNVTRLAGETRYETSAAIATWELTQGMSATSAAIATGQNFPDALAGAAFSGLKNSILLLADDTNSAEAVSVLETQKGKVETLYIYGGTNSVSETVKDACATAVGVREG